MTDVELDELEQLIFDYYIDFIDFDFIEQQYRGPIDYQKWVELAKMIGLDPSWDVDFFRRLEAMREKRQQHNWKKEGF